MTTLKTRVMDEIKLAMKAGDKPRLATLRLMSAALKQVEIDTRSELADSEIMAILEKMKKQRKDSIEQYITAGRNDLVAQEESEIEIIKEFLPTPFEPAALQLLVEQAIAETLATSVSDTGKVMDWLQPKIAGRASSKDVGALIRKILS
jgi:uncharacterized protein YqeY